MIHSIKVVAEIQPLIIEPSEVLRYLGYRGQALDETIRTLITDCIAEAHTLVRPKTRHLFFPISGPTLSLGETGIFLPGQDIAQHLSGCRQCVLMAATLGITIENRLRVLQSADMSRAVVMEAVASTYIEALCDQTEAAIRQEANRNGHGLTGRFSPGYGDLPLSIQPRFLQVLDAGRKIGLYCTETCIMTPRKSVTAVLGVLEGAAGDGPSAQTCENCQQQGQCPYEKGGSYEDKGTN